MRPPQKSKRLKRYDDHRHRPSSSHHSTPLPTVPRHSTTGGSATNRKSPRNSRVRSRRECEFSFSGEEESSSPSTTPWSTQYNNSHREEEEEEEDYSTTGSGTTTRRDDEEEHESRDLRVLSRGRRLDYYDDDQDGSLILEEEDEDSFSNQSQQRMRPYNTNHYEESTHTRTDDTTVLSSVPAGSEEEDTKFSTRSSGVSQLSHDTEDATRHRNDIEEEDSQSPSYSRPSASVIEQTTVSKSQQKHGLQFAVDLPHTKNRAEEEGNAQKEEELCILSMEPESRPGSQKPPTSFIINEPSGGVVDPFVEDSSRPKEDTTTTATTTTLALSKSHSAFKDNLNQRLGCDFSIEPASPMSEWSSANNTITNCNNQQQQRTGPAVSNKNNNNALVLASSSRKLVSATVLQSNWETGCDAMHAVLDHYVLPSDSSAFDQYLPSFPSSEDTLMMVEQDDSQALVSNSSTCHPLRFVNELAMMKSDETAGLRRWGYHQKHRQEQQQREKSHTIEEEEGIEVVEDEFDYNSQLALKRGMDNNDRQHHQENNNNDDEGYLQKCLSNISIQIVSPRYRGWKSQELETVLMQHSAPHQEMDDHNKVIGGGHGGSGDGVAEQGRKKAPVHRNNAGSIPSLPLATTNASLTSSHIRDLNDLQLELAGTINESSPQSLESSSYYHSYSSDDEIPRPPVGTEDQRIESENENIDEGKTDYSNNWQAKPLSLSVNVHAPVSQTPTNTLSPNNSTAMRKAKMRTRAKLVKQKQQQLRQQQQEQSCFRSPKQDSIQQDNNNHHMAIRSTKSEEAMPTHAFRSYLDTIVEQLEPIMNDSTTDGNIDPDMEDKENRQHSTTDIWQSSLDSLRQLKARQVSQRQLLTSLIAERNGAKATASTAKNKLTQWSERYQDSLFQQETEIEHLRRANRTLRVHVAHIQAMKLPKDALEAEVARKLQFLNKHGAPIERREPDNEAHSKGSSRLYRSERKISSQLIEIEKCMFELQTQEVTTLEVSDASRAIESAERRDHAAGKNSTDHEIQIAISKIVEQRTASLQQKIETLEKDLEAERNKKQSHIKSPEMLKTILDKSRRTTIGAEQKARIAAPSSKTDLQMANEEKDCAVAKWKSESNQRETLSKRLNKAQDDLKTMASKNEKLTKQLADTLSSNQTYKDHLSSAQKELKALKKEPNKVIEQKDKSLKYYKKKALSLEGDLDKLKLIDKELAAEYRSQSAEATRNEIRSLREHVESLQRDYSTAEAGRMKALAQIEATELDLKKARRDMKDRNKDNAQLLQKVASAEAVSESNDTGETKQKLLEKDEYLLHYKRSVSKLEQEISALRENEKISSEVAKTEMTSLRQLVEKLHLDYEEAKQDRDETNSRYRTIEKELKRLRRDYEGTEQDRTETLKRCKELEGELETTMSNLKSTSLDNEEVTLRAGQLYAAKEECDEKIANLEAEMARLKEDAKKQITERDERIKNLKNTISMLEDEIREGQIQCSEAANEALREKATNLEQQLCEAIQERDDSAANLQAASQDLGRLRGQLEEMTEEKTKLSAEVQQLLVIKEDYEGRVSNLMTDVTKCQNESKYAREEKKKSADQYVHRIASLESEITTLKKREKSSAEELRKDLGAREEVLTQLSHDMKSTEKERDELATAYQKIAKDLDRTKRDLESRILDNSELALRIEQLYAAKEECEEKIATMETMLQEQTLQAAETFPTENDENLLMSKMRITTLEQEVEELKELASTEREIAEATEGFSDDVYIVNREKQEALAKCAFLTKENEKISALLESTRGDLSQTIIEISRLEMDLDDARSGGGLVTERPDSNSADSRKKIDYLAKQNAKLSVNLQQITVQNRTLLDKVKQLEYESAKTDSEILQQDVDSNIFSREVQRLEQLLVDARMQIADQQKAMEKATADASSDAEKRALMDEIQRLQRLLDTSQRYAVEQQDALDRSMDEISSLKDMLVCRDAHDKTQSSFAGQEMVYLRNKVSEVQEELEKARERCRSEQQHNADLEEKLKHVEARAKSSEKEAAHFRLQISQMEEKIYSSDESLGNALNSFRDEEEKRESLSSKLERVEAQLKEKQQDVERLSAALDSIRTQEQETADTMAYKNDILQTHKSEYSKMLQKKDEILKNLTADLAKSQSNEAKLRKSIKESHVRDRKELLVLREQVSNLQNDVVTAEEARKKIADEKYCLSLKFANISKSLDEKQSETKKLDEAQKILQSKVLTSEDDRKKIYEEKLALTLELEKTSKSLEETKKLAEMYKLFGNDNNDAVFPEGISASVSQLSDNHEARLSEALKEQKERIDALSDCLDKAAEDKEAHLNEIMSLKQELAAFRSPTPLYPTSAHHKTHKSCLEEVFIIPSLHETGYSPQPPHSPGAQFSAGLSCSSDLTSINSKMVKSVGERRNLHAQKLNDQLALSQKREEEVSRTVLRKVSLLKKEIAKLTGNVCATSFDERSHMSGSFYKSQSVDSSDNNIEYDLECRLADVTQFSSMLEVLISDKKKCEQKLRALSKANLEYLDEIKETIAEEDETVHRQGAVLETLNEELEALQEREKTETRTLVGEISLLEENISHLREQFDTADKTREQAENKLEIAMRELQSLEVALKQIKSEKEHCETRMPRVSCDLESFQVELEGRLAKLKDCQSCSDLEDHHLVESVVELKKELEDFLSYCDHARRKELRVQTVPSESGETEYFLTLNDYDYQLLEENVTSTEEKQAIKAAASSEKKFMC